MPEYLNVQEVADLLKCSARTVNSLRTNEGLPSVKLGRLVRFSKESVLAWLAEKQKTPCGVKSLANQKQEVNANDLAFSLD